jgi:hypothetical protein
MQPFLCPQCKTNRTRFNLIEQHAFPVKLDALTGELEKDYRHEPFADPLHATYHGVNCLIQCGTCSYIGEEITYVKAAQLIPAGKIPR